MHLGGYHCSFITCCPPTTSTCLSSSSLGLIAPNVSSARDIIALVLAFAACSLAASAPLHHHAPPRTPSICKACLPSPVSPCQCPTTQAVSRINQWAAYTQTQTPPLFTTFDTGEWPVCSCKEHAFFPVPAAPLPWPSCLGSTALELLQVRGLASNRLAG